MRILKLYQPCLGWRMITVQISQHDHARLQCGVVAHFPRGTYPRQRLVYLGGTWGYDELDDQAWDAREAVRATYQAMGGDQPHL